MICPGLPSLVVNPDPLSFEVCPCGGGVDTTDAEGICEFKEYAA